MPLARRLHPERSLRFPPLKPEVAELPNALPVEEQHFVRWRRWLARVLQNAVPRPLPATARKVLRILVILIIAVLPWIAFICVLFAPDYYFVWPRPGQWDYQLCLTILLAWVALLSAPCAVYLTIYADERSRPAFLSDDDEKNVHLYLLSVGCALVVFVGLMLCSVGAYFPVCGDATPRTFFITASAQSGGVTVADFYVLGHRLATFSLAPEPDDPSTYTLRMTGSDAALVSYDFTARTAVGGARTSLASANATFGRDDLGREAMTIQGDLGLVALTDIDTAVLPGTRPPNFSLGIEDRWGDRERVMKTLGVARSDCRTLVVCSRHLSVKSKLGWQPLSDRVLFPLGVAMYRQLQYALTCGNQ